MTEIPSLYLQARRIQRRWRSLPDGYAQLQAAWACYRQHGEELRQRLPFRTVVAYAYSPRESASSGGACHIITQERVRAGRLVREPGAALCRPTRDFWGLEEREGRADCKRCLEVAERLADAALAAAGEREA